MNGISHFNRGGLRGASEYRFALLTRLDVMVVRCIYRKLRGAGVGPVWARALLVDILSAGQSATLSHFPKAAS